MIKVILVFLLSFNILFAKNSTDKMLFCLYSELKHPIDLLKEEELLNTENIKNLLYSKAHEKEYFYKALVLDYLYNGNNIEEYYKNAYLNSDILNKEKTGLYYAIFLQRNGKYKEAISLLRKLDIFASKKMHIADKVAYAYVLSSIKDDIKIESYLNIKKIDMNKIKSNINECSK